MLEQWQSRLLPFMVSMLIAVAIFFSAATLWQYGRIAGWMTQPSPPPAGTMWTDPSLQPATFEQRMAVAQRRAEFALEGDVIRRRYEQNNQAITTRLWARFMGFMTGMIMAIVGAAFILGKLEDKGTEITTAAPLAASIKSASPGLVLAALGTVLIGLSLSIQVTVNVRDVPVYFGGSAAAAIANSAIPAEAVPQMLPDESGGAVPSAAPASDSADAIIQAMPTNADGN